LASFPFPEIELEHDYDPEPQLYNSIPLSDSIMTEVFLPDFRPFPESVLDLVPIYREIKSPIFYDQQIELDHFHTFESPIDKLASSYFYEIELRQECDFNPQIYDLVQIPESILTPILLPNLSNILESVLTSTPVILKLESSILESHIPLRENKCGIGFQFLDLDPILEPIWTPEPLFDLSQIPESILVHILLESKSIIPSFHTLFWNKGVNKIDSEIILKI